MYLVGSDGQFLEYFGQNKKSSEIASSIAFSGGSRIFLLGVLMGGLNSSEGVLKKRIKLRESNERLNFSYQFFYIQQLRKGTFYFFSAVINFSYATVISNNVKHDTYKVK